MSVKINSYRNYNIGTGIPLFFITSIRKVNFGNLAESDFKTELWKNKDYHLPRFLEAVLLDLI